jgi:hypothetical protein
MKKVLEIKVVGYHNSKPGVNVWGTAPTRRIGPEKSQIEHIGAHSE